MQDDVGKAFCDLRWRTAHPHRWGCGKRHQIADDAPQFAN
jgi:hypothetical protein